MNNTDDKKFSNAVSVIYDHIDQPITLEDIAHKVGLSLASLKRLFHQAIEQSPGAFIRRLRMELAFQSLKSRKNSVLEVAMASGFDNQSAFARQFKKTFGYTPSKAREKINILSELDYAELEDPDIVELEDINLQSVTETGLYFESAPKAWQRLKEKLSDTELSDDFSGVFIGIGHDNPHESNVSQDKVRFSACIAYLTRDIHADSMRIVGGQYARFRYLGKPNNLGLAYHYIFGQWVDKSSLSIDNQKPAFSVFDQLPKGLKKHKIMIHVPVQ